MIRSNQEIRQLIEEETKVLFQLTHHSAFKIQIQTLKLLFQFAKATKKFKSQEVQVAKEESNEDGLGSFNDRYYRALYEVLLKVHLTKPTKLDEFFALVFKSVKTDPNLARTLAFIRRMI